MYATIPSEVKDLFVDNLDWTDFISYAHSGRDARSSATSVFSLRVEKLLDPYIPVDHRPAFWAQLDAGEGGVSGSGAFWVMEASPTWIPRNLNTVVRSGAGDRLRDFLVAIGCKERYAKSWVPLVAPRAVPGRMVEAYPLLSLLADFTWYFESPAPLFNRITVTETQDSSVIRHLLGAKHSLQAMLLTQNTLLAFYPLASITRRTLVRAGGVRCSGNSGSMALSHSIRSMNLVASSSSAHDSMLCPALLRRLRGGSGIGLFCWSRANFTDLVGLEGDAYTGFTSDKYAFTWTWTPCKDISCEFHVSSREITVDGQRPVFQETNPKLLMLRIKSHAIRSCVPVSIFGFIDKIKLKIGRHSTLYTKGLCLQHRVLCLVLYHYLWTTASGPTER
jgi:hypothetical protein